MKLNLINFNFLLFAENILSCIDKTNFILRLIMEPNLYLLTRPKCFGRALVFSSLAYFLK